MLTIKENTEDLSNIKICLVSLGCDKNLVDSEVMLGILRDRQYTITAVENDARIIIINTCGFILDAAGEAVVEIQKAINLKKSGSCRTIIVTGCLVSRYKEDIFSEFPEVDAILGTNNYNEIAEVITKSINTKHASLLSDKGSFDEETILKRVLSTSKATAFIKIAEGCDNCCTYCTIPQIKGSFRSRSMDAIVREAAILAEQGVKEVTLVAQDTSLYGSDRIDEASLPLLLRKLSEVDGIKWIRILYCYPEHITDALIQEMATNSKVCKYIDMPIQHSANSVLKRMGRRSTNEKLREIIGKLRSAMPDIVIRTTLITGFPGETRKDFLDMVRFIEEIRFDRLGVFAYSQEEDTPAAIMDNQVKASEKETRREKLMLAQQAISAEKLAEFVGAEMPVLIEGQIKSRGEIVYFGRSWRDAYQIDGLIYVRSGQKLQTGDFVKVRITGSNEYDLEGEYLELTE